MPGEEGLFFDWYSLIQNTAGIEQGDFLDNFPIPIPPIESYDEVINEEGEKNIPINIQLFNFIVMTQSCDFQKMQDIESVILCPRVDFQVAFDGKSKTDKKSCWVRLTQGRIINIHLINKCEITNYDFDYQTVNLRDIYSVPYGYVKKVASNIPNRVRLLSPYKEHLSQAFARQFMRVGLPLDLPRDYPY